VAVAPSPCACTAFKLAPLSDLVGACWPPPPLRYPVAAGASLAKRPLLGASVVYPLCWRAVLEPVVARHGDTVKRRSFRADAEGHSHWPHNGDHARGSVFWTDPGIEPLRDVIDQRLRGARIQLDIEKGR
jgi:hypothetical protein